MSLKNWQGHAWHGNKLRCGYLSGHGHQKPKTIKKKKKSNFRLKKEEVEPGIEPGSSSLQVHPPTNYTNPASSHFLHFYLI